MAKADMAVIIVNWKVRDLLKKCLDSILIYQKNYQLEIFVVDNDSQDGSAEMLKDDYPMVSLMALEKNIGFGAANNLAIKKATGEYIFLLNPDTEITADFFEKAFSYMQNNPAVGILGPRIINSDGSQQASIRNLPNLLSQSLTLFKLQNILCIDKPLEPYIHKVFVRPVLKIRKLFSNSKVLRHYLAEDFDYNKEQAVDQIMGAAMFIRRSVFDKIGVFDTKFFVWFEEVDLCEQAKKAGILIKYFPEAIIIHWGGQSFSQSHTLKKQLIFNKSLLYYFFKHKPFIQTLIIFLLIPINIGLTLIYVTFFKNKGK